MPIYAYRCTACGHAKDVLQKLSDAPLRVCPACGAETFTKQVTAAGFQLKGSGWYVTDFRGGNQAGAKGKDAKESSSGDGAEGQGADKPASKGAEPGASKGADKPAAPAADKSSSAAPAAPKAPSPSPSSGSGG